MKKQNNFPTILIILDGFGFSKKMHYNAVAQADMPHYKAWWQEYPHALLQAAGTAVGLLPGMIGNSEVGHLTIGAGQVIEQPISFINRAIDDGRFFANPALMDNLKKLAHTNGALHLIGLLSDAGVHSHEQHLFAFMRAAAQQNVKKIYIHAILDGRDVSPQSAATYLAQLDAYTQKIGYGTLASIIGRFYAMDRDHNWQRTEEAYNMLTERMPSQFATWQQALSYYYQQGIMDEFLPPVQLDPKGIIGNGDGIICFNFRPDRSRQLAACFLQPNFHAFARKNIELSFFITPVDYHDRNFKTIVLYKEQLPQKTLKDVLATAHKSFFAIAETEKYAHVTYFFSGGKEQQYPNETRVLIPSLPAKNYIDHPEMSAAKITAAVLHSLRTDPKDFYLINYANPDMVGHSGNLPATIKALEFLDGQLAQLYQEIVLGMNGTLYITADHGKAEDMFDESTGQPRTAHTNNPVPFIMIRKDLYNKPQQLPLTQLADIAPFILKNMHLAIPDHMT